MGPVGRLSLDGRYVAGLHLQTPISDRDTRLRRTPLDSSLEGTVAISLSSLQLQTEGPIPIVPHARRLASYRSAPYSFANRDGHLKFGPASQGRAVSHQPESPGLSATICSCELAGFSRSRPGGTSLSH